MIPFCLLVSPLTGSFLSLYIKKKLFQTKIIPSWYLAARPVVKSLLVMQGKAGSNPGWGTKIPTHHRATKPTHDY